ncbi:MAG TPA: hypothetical protein VGI31_12525 [Streptosporangiaceae bacterium]
MLHAADEGRQPALDVTNPHAPRLSDRVLTGMDADGQWWLWWSFAEKIAPPMTWTARSRSSPGCSPTAKTPDPRVRCAVIVRDSRWPARVGRRWIQ